MTCSQRSWVPKARTPSDGIGVPTFGEHRDGDDATDGSAELAELAYSCRNHLSPIVRRSSARNFAGIREHSGAGTRIFSQSSQPIQAS